MIKNTVHSIVLCNSRNELIDALNAKTVAIEISKELQDTIIKEFQEQYKGHGWGKAGAALGILDIICAIPTGGLSLFAFLFNVFLAGAGLSASLTDFRKYRVAVFNLGLGDRLVMLSSRFNYEYDSLASLEAYQFVKIELAKKCTACDHDIKKEIDWIEHDKINPFACHVCNQKIIWTIKPQEYAKDTRKGDKTEKKQNERAQEARLRRKGLSVERDYSVDVDAITSLAILKVEDVGIVNDAIIPDIAEYKQKLKNNELVSKMFFSPSDGTIYNLVLKFYSVKFGTAEAEESIIDLKRFVNIRGRQIYGNPMKDEKRGCRQVQKCFSNGTARLDENGKYENVLKEAAWFAVHSILFQVLASSGRILQLIPKAGMPAIGLWNAYIDQMQDAPDSVKDLFIMNDNGCCKFTEQVVSSAEK